MVRAYVYICQPKSKDDTHPYHVGFYSSDNVFDLESSHPDKDAAAKRVHYLNGGN